MYWHTNSMVIPKELDQNDFKNSIENFTGTRISERNFYSQKSSLTFFDRRRFQVEMKRNELLSL